MSSARYAAAVERAEKYAKKRKLEIEDKLGSGCDGVVFATRQQTALKAEFYPEVYTKELKVYKRLLERNVERVCGFSVPKLVNCDDSLWVIEMQIVTPPFVVDFVAGYVDEKPVFPPELIEEEETAQEEVFGEQWPVVQSLISGFRRHGIYLSDIHKGNINFGTMHPS